MTFPYWEESLGWRSTGQRIDTVHGRTVTTVFYSNSQGRRVGYAIVAGSPAPHTSGGTLWRHRGTAYRVQEQDGVEVVSWLRSGHLCVVSGRGVTAPTLLGLASWQSTHAARS